MVKWTNQGYDIKWAVGSWLFIHYDVDRHNNVGAGYAFRRESERKGVLDDLGFPPGLLPAIILGSMLSNGPEHYYHSFDIKLALGSNVLCSMLIHTSTKKDETLKTVRNKIN